MKTMKKTWALVLAVVMALALAIPAYAAPTNVNITVPSSDSHTYEVYQIFTGELAGGILSNVHWGQNGTGTQNALVEKTTLDTMAAITGTDAEKAEALAAYANLTGSPFGTVSKDAPLTAPTGYYLIKDVSTHNDDDTDTLYILQVVGPTEIARKAAGTPTPDKTVDETNDSDAAKNATDEKVADYDIGDAVPFHVKATLPGTGLDKFKTYKVVLQDTLESGRFSGISALNIAGPTTETENYTVTVDQGTPTVDGFKVTVTFAAKEGKTLESLQSRDITIDFTATLGPGAQIGGDGNDNTFVVKFSDNPNDNQSGEPDSSTPEVKVTVFTYNIVVNKTDEKNDPLTGAGFTLYKVSKDDATAGVTGADAAAKNTAWAAKALATAGTWTPSVEGAEFTFTGLDAGYYVLCETTTPAGYNTIDPQAFVVEATYKDNATKDGKEIDTLTATALTGSTITFTPDVSAGSLSATVQNQKGTELPETGGIGTKIFYTMGAVLVIGAGVVLVSRKRAAE